jgi:hypothetical protein
MIELNQAIYEKYFLAARNSGMIWTINDYAVRKGLMKEEDSDEADAYDIPEIQPHYKTIQYVLTMEISIWVFRRLNGPWGEVIDALASLRNQTINKYREETGYEIDTENDKYREETGYEIDTENDFY